MRIENSNISFGANFCNYAKVLKYEKSCGKYNPEDVSFVIIDSNNESDILALKEVYRDWNSDVLAEAILRTAVSKAFGERYFARNKVFALTVQGDKFEKLNPKEIIGLADIRVLNSKGHIFLEHIKVKPLFNEFRGEIIKKIGSAILDSLKAKFPQIYLVALEKQQVKDFYLRNGFVEYPKDSSHFVWSKR